jgi:HEAT repeat protein
VPCGWIRQEAFCRGKPTSYWIRALKKESFLGRSPPAGDVGMALLEGGPEAVGVLCEIAQNSDEGVRLDALIALNLMGSESRAAAPMLAKTIRNEKDSARFIIASRCLAKADHELAMATFTEVLRDRVNGSGRPWTLAVLLELAPDCQGMLPALRETLADPDPKLRVQAAAVLWRLREPADHLVLVLCEAACAERAPAGCQALAVLVEMGANAKSALPCLLKILARPNLAAVGPRWGSPHAAAIVRALGSLGPEAASAVPSLRHLLKNGNMLLDAEVTQALAKIESPANER